MSLPRLRFAPRARLLPRAFAFLPPLATVLVLCPIEGGGVAANSVAEPLALTARREYQDLIRSDMIVRGEVLSVAEEHPLAKELNPKWKGDGYGVVAIIVLRIGEVIWGSASGEEVITFLVEMNSSTHRAEYRVGQEVVVGLDYRAQFRGGTYFGGPRETLFVRSGDVWIRQGHFKGRSEHTVEEIRALVAPYQLDVVFESAAIVVIGELVQSQKTVITDPMGEGTGRVWTISMDVEEVLKGEDVPTSLTFEMFGGGVYWPPWADVRPGRFYDSGKRYCVFLSALGGRLYVTGGVNGLFGAEGTHLLRNELLLPITLDRVRAMAAGDSND